MSRSQDFALAMKRQAQRPERRKTRELENYCGFVLRRWNNQPRELAACCGLLSQLWTTGELATCCGLFRKRGASRTARRPDPGFRVPNAPVWWNSLVHIFRGKYASGQMSLLIHGVHCSCRLNACRASRARTNAGRGRQTCQTVNGFTVVQTCRTVPCF